MWLRKTNYWPRKLSSRQPDRSRIKNGVSVNEQYERIMEIYENSDIIE